MLFLKSRDGWQMPSFPLYFKITGERGTIMAKSDIRDMTTGSPFQLILGFAVPMLLGLLFQQFYSMVDTITWV